MRSGWYVPAVAALLAMPSPASAVPPPARGWEPPALVSATRAARETSLAVSPRNAAHLLSCAPSGTTAGGQSWFHRSADGGRTWQPANVEAGGADQRPLTPDGVSCDVAYDAGGTAWAADSWSGGISVSHSTNGTSWQGTALAAGTPGVDRPWLAGGPAGTAYLTYQQVQCCLPSVLWFTKTADYGRTFSPPVRVATATADGAFTWQGNLAVAPSGRDLYVAFTRRMLANVDAGTPATIELAASHDGGATWTTTVVERLAAEPDSVYPGVAVDAGGLVHLVWAADAGVRHTVSADGGRAWRAPVRVDDGTGTAFAPSVAGGKKGQARIAFLGTPHENNTVHAPWYFYVARVDGTRRTLTVTTKKPVWTGEQDVPGYGSVEVDRTGRIHLAMSVYQGASAAGTWAAFHQRERR